MAQIISFHIIHDTTAESPREWGNLGTFIMQHNKYDFGDCKFEVDGNYISFKKDFKYHLKQVHNCTIKDVVYLPVYMYDHSSQTINTTGFSDYWDSGQIGYIYVLKSRLREVYNVKRISKNVTQAVKEAMESEIALLDQWLQGDIYGYEIKYNDNTVNACWGFYGEDPRMNGMWEHWSESEQCYYLKHNIQIKY